MKAFRVLLTHFSQRYPKIPVYSPPNDDNMHKNPSDWKDHDYQQRVCVAFDLMKIRLTQMSWVPLLMPAFELIFPASEDVDDNDEDMNETT